MELLVDIRERHIMDLLREYNPEVIRLSAGDILIVKENTGILIERKTPSDFIFSIRSNRLWEQLLKMIKYDRIGLYMVKRRMLLIHGPLELNAQIFGALMEILFVYEIPIIFLNNDFEFKEFFRILLQREERGLNDKVPQERWYRKRFREDLPEKDKKIYILASLPYIGNVLAKNLFAEFGSIASIATAPEKDLMNVKGIGEKRAKLIYRMFH
ncbi:MAG: ERCC4-type nuclease [Methanomicrobia archaeon]|nr:ERCC4-type nuclease [Methanomicrobia archaeon]HDM23028.1 ERCC4-type nuclease [Methanomicrobia archaeon]